MPATQVQARAALLEEPPAVETPRALREDPRVLADLAGGCLRSLTINAGMLKLKEDSRMRRGKMSGGHWKTYWFALRTAVTHPDDTVALCWYAGKDDKQLAATDEMLKLVGGDHTLSRFTSQRVTIL